MRTIQRFAVVLAVATTAVAFAVFPAAAQGGGACQMNGTANFSPPLSNTAGNFSYNFSAALSSCQSNEAGAPASGTVEVGKVYTDATGEQFQEPAATGNGTCANGTTQGTSIAFWADKTTTVISYTTTSAAAAVNLQGNVVPSITLPAINPGTGQPTSITITTTRYLGDQSQGALAFQADPTACAGAGVSSAAVSGVVGIGSAS